MKLKEIFIFYNLFALCTLLIGFFSAILLMQNFIINIKPIPILSVLLIIFVINYHLFGEKVQKIFIKLF